MSEYKLMFSHRIKVYDKKDEQGKKVEGPVVLLAKEFILPFAPYPGLVIKEFGPGLASGGISWKVASHTSAFSIADFYWDSWHARFVCETRMEISGEPPNDVDSILKLRLAEGLVVVQKEEVKNESVGGSTPETTQSTGSGQG